MNMEKKHTGRFCIQFNSMDSQHTQVIELLELQGRRKANYIADAILHYINCTVTSQTTGQNDIAAIRPMVVSVIRELVGKGEIVINNGDKNEFLKEIPNVAEAVEAIDEDLIASIRDSVSSIRSES
jgi:hypothetical protein